MTATDELRRLLDERGVEWTPSVFDRQHETFYSTENGVGFIVTEFPEIGRMSLACDMRITPEQAVEATLGGDLKAENDKLRELVRDLYMALWTCNQHTCKHGNDGCYTEDGNSGGRCTLHDRMYELGVGL